MLLSLLTPAFAGDPPVPRDAPASVRPRRLWDVTHLELDVRIDPEARTVEGSATHRLEPLGRPHDRVRFHQRALDIQAATVDGEPADFELGEDWVDVRLPPGTAHEVRLDYQARPSKGLYFRSPAWDDDHVEVFSQGEDEDNRWWFPSWDHPTDRFAVTTHVTVPSELTARALGELTGKRPAGEGLTRWSFALEQEVVAYLVTVVAGDYEVFELDGGPVPIEVLAGRGVDRERLLLAMEPVPAQLHYYEELLDEPFPYPSARFVFVQRYMYGGMENPTLTVLKDRLIPAVDDPLHLRHTEDVLAHEVVHHWFGDLLTCYGWNEWWLNEGFARFYEKRWAREAHGDEVWALDNRRGFAWARTAERALAPDAANRSHPVASWNGSYPKGAHVLRALRVHLGEAVFDAAIREYVERHKGRLVETHDLRRTLEDVSGEPLGWFFEQWVTGRGAASWTVEREWGGGRLTLTFVPDPDGPPFHAPVEVEIGTGEGPRIEKLWLGPERVQVVLPARERPRYVAFDPRWGVLGELQHEQEAAAWLAQLAGSPHAPARIDALVALGGVETDEAVVDALLAHASLDRDPVYQAAAIRALERHAHEPRVEAFLVGRAGRVHGETALVAREAARRLPATPVSLDTLEELALTAEDPWVRGAAFMRLTKHDAQRGATLARRVLRRADPGREGWLHARAIEALVADGQALAVAPFFDDPRPLVRWRATAEVAEELRAGSITGRPAERLQRMLAEAVAYRLDDPEWASRESALAAAAGLREVDVPMLRRFAARNPDPALDELAFAAIRAIRHPQRKDAQLDERIQALEERLDALGGEVDATRERLDQLDDPGLRAD